MHKKIMGDAVEKWANCGFGKVWPNGRRYCLYTEKTGIPCGDSCPGYMTHKDMAKIAKKYLEEHKDEAKI